MQNQLFLLLKLALEQGKSFVLLKSDIECFKSMGSKDWETLYDIADKQTLVGIAFLGVKKLCAAVPEVQPPLDLMFQWSSEAETVCGLNKLMNKEAARLTELFCTHGFATAILKGQANARLYPDPLCRQPGDIDIWVDGGKEKVKDLLATVGMVVDSSQFTEHHYHLKKNEAGIDVEVHYELSSGNLSPVTTARIRKYLNAEIKHGFMAPEGFYCPSIKFALVMQLSHIQRHFFKGGIGLRQLVDYWVLLQNSSKQDREELASLLNRFGFRNLAGGLVWLLKEKFGIDEQLQFCKPDPWRGKRMLKDILYGGNFGHHTNEPRKRWLFWWLGKHRKKLRYICFDFRETCWAEYYYWKKFFRSTPERIRKRKISLRPKA